MRILHQYPDEFMQLVGVAGHEFSAVPDFFRGLIARTVCNWIETNDAPTLRVTESIVKRVQFAVNDSLALALPDAFDTPIAIAVAHRIRYGIDRDGLPEFQQLATVAGFLNQSAPAPPVQVFVEIAIFPVAADDFSNRCHFDFDIGVFVCPDRRPAFVKFLPSVL